MTLFPRVKTRHARGGLIVVAASALLLLTVVAPAWAASPLDGEFWQAPDDPLALEFVGPGDPPGCSLAGPSTISFSGTGPVSGPYPGTISVSGTFGLGAQINTIPPDPDFIFGVAGYPAGSEPVSYGPLTSVSGTFTITSGATTVSGTLTGFGPPLSSFAKNVGSCYGTDAEKAFGYENLDSSAVFMWDANLTYSATITGLPSPVSGRVIFRQRQACVQGATVSGCEFTGPVMSFYSPSSSNSPPSVEAGGAYAGDEGAAIALDGTVSDPDGDSLATTWTYAPVSGVDPGATCSFGDASAVDTTISCTDDGVYSVTLTAADGTNAPVSDSATLEVSNVAPGIVVTVPVEGSLYAINTVVNVSAALSDDGTNDTHSCSLDWDDSSSSSGSVSESNGSGACSGSHSYAAAGVYTIDVTVTDDDGAPATASVMIVVYDPDGGFVTGGGWITSPAGALTSDPSATGKANFGFVSKYKKGATVPDGQTEFQFQAGSLNFHSSSYQWLVVNQNGCRAQFKGTGTINGAGTYGFMLWAYDGGCSAEPGSDKFRIKIWDGTDESSVVYDNGGAYPGGQPLGGGSIVVLVKK